MPNNDLTSDRPLPGDIKEWIRCRYEGPFPGGGLEERKVFHTGLAALDRLFPSGIPYGQLIELTGSASCGKTSLLLSILAGQVKEMTAAYIDVSDMFFPGAAQACGVNLDRLIVVRPRSLPEALRTMELLLRYRVVGCLACDLVTQYRALSTSWLHRLRTHTVRRHGLVFFLTEDSRRIIAPSMMSVRLQVQRRDASTIQVVVAKSRISPEGVTAEVKMNAR